MEKPGVLQFMGSQRVGHDSATEQQQLAENGKISFLGVYLRIQVVGYKPVPNAHLEMSADRSSREDRGVLWLDGPDFYAGVLRLKDFADAAEGPAGADSRAPSAYIVNVPQNILS